MGLFDTFMNALGLQPVLKVREPGPLAFTTAAKMRMMELSDQGCGIHIELAPARGGKVVQVTEGVSQGPPPPGYDDDLAFTVSDPDLQSMKGLRLHYQDGRWSVGLSLEVRAKETPNPDGRLYLTDRVLARGRPVFFTGTGAEPPLAERVLAVDGVKSVLIRENTVTVEREPDTSWDAIDRGVDGALREHFLLCGGPLDADALPTLDDPLAKDVYRVIRERVLPAIHKDGGDLEFLGIDDGVVRVSLVGACRTCPASTITLKNGIEQTLMDAFPGQIQAVEQV